VLRGPQGTLFGRNTPAGVVKFESVRPPGKAEGYGSIGYGTFSTVNLEGAVNGRSAPELVGARVSLL
jgi:iron complex outermembrane recepter protein